MRRERDSQDYQQSVCWYLLLSQTFIHSWNFVVRKKRIRSDLKKKNREGGKAGKRPIADIIKDHLIWQWNWVIPFSNPNHDMNTEFIFFMCVCCWLIILLFSSVSLIFSGKINRFDLFLVSSHIKDFSVLKYFLIPPKHWSPQIRIFTSLKQ